MRGETLQLPVIRKGRQHGYLEVAVSFRPWGDSTTSFSRHSYSSATTHQEDLNPSLQPAGSFKSHGSWRIADTQQAQDQAHGSTHVPGSTCSYDACQPAVQPHQNGASAGARIPGSPLSSWLSVPLAPNPNEGSCAARAPQGLHTVQSRRPSIGSTSEAGSSRDFYPIIRSPSSVQRQHSMTDSAVQPSGTHLLTNNSPAVSNGSWDAELAELVRSTAALGQDMQRRLWAIHQEAEDCIARDSAALKQIDGIQRGQVRRRIKHASHNMAKCWGGSYHP